MVKNFILNYFFLSNFYETPISYEGLTFQSSETAFQAAKTLDANEREKFVSLNPSKAKQMGRRISLRPDWEEVKDEEMLKILRIKFAKGSDLDKKLINTGNEELIEGNTWHDNYWGDCSCERCKYKKGLNTLGKLLMQVRNELRKVA